jgi:hypothetical protein
MLDFVKEAWDYVKTHDNLKIILAIATLIILLILWYSIFFGKPSIKAATPSNQNMDTIPVRAETPITGKNVFEGGHSTYNQPVHVGDVYNTVKEKEVAPKGATLSLYRGPDFMQTGNHKVHTIGIQLKNSGDLTAKNITDKAVIILKDNESYQILGVKQNASDIDNIVEAGHYLTYELLLNKPIGNKPTYLFVSFKYSDSMGRQGEYKKIYGISEPVTNWRILQADAEEYEGIKAFLQFSKIW